MKNKQEPEHGKSQKQQTIEAEPTRRSATEKAAESTSHSRRAFLGKVTAATIAAGFIGVPALTELQQAAAQVTDYSCPAGCELGPLTGVARADTAHQRRVTAADCERAKPIPTHPCNGDEARYSTRNYFASYTKGLPHIYEKFGEVDSAAYCALLRALASGNPNDFELVPLGCVPCTTATDTGQVTSSSDEASRGGAPQATTPPRQRKLESPQAGYNFDTEGIDYHQAINRPASTQPVAFPPAFTFDSAEEAVEIVENYWQALTRDVPFKDYKSSDLVNTAAADLQQFGLYYKGPREGGQVTWHTYSRGILAGDLIGPFVSQYLLLDIPYGSQMIDPRIQTVQPGIDYMTNFDEWFTIQNGCTPRQSDALNGRVFIRSGRDIGQYVHIDQIYQAYFNAALILQTPRSMGGLGAPLDPNNPYLRSCTQLNFVEFGISQLLSLIGEVSVRAHKAVWYQKWQVHRRLRPEEFGARVHFWKSGQQDRYPVNSIINASKALSLTKEKYGSYFLPQAFPEGSPVHPSYGAGHATLAGACVTILKAWFDESARIVDLTTPVEATSDGSSRVAYTQNDASQMTVGSELNKLASNIAIARNIAGVHWRSDYTESVYLGEQIAINLLRDYGFTYNENFSGFNLTNFSNNQQVVGGKVTTTCPQ